MKKEKNNMDKIGKWGIIGFILSLPIMIWKSSKVGKIIALFLILGVSIGAVGKLSDVYFNKIRYRVKVEAELDPVKKEIEGISDRAKSISYEVENMENILKEKKDEILKRITNQTNKDLEARKDEISKRFDEVETTLEEISGALNIIKESERQAIKEKIILIKEQVKIFKKSIDSAEIRIELEKIADKLYILTDKERSRFYEDLKEIGFKIEKEKENVTQIYAGNYSMCSGGGFIQYVQVEDYRR